MTYSNGTEIIVGDKVMADDSKGTVVCVLDTKQFSDKYPQGWTDEDKGIFIETQKWGLIHYPEVDEDVVFMERAKT